MVFLLNDLHGMLEWQGCFNINQTWKDIVKYDAPCPFIISISYCIWPQYYFFISKTDTSTGVFTSTLLAFDVIEN
jgi:hypothetical protein